MPTIGLTGNFGMGKTSVLSLFKKSGAYTFNIDEFVHQILNRPETIRKIARALGDNILIRGPKLSINKTRVAKLIFNDSEKRKAVEKIIHPQVLKFVKSTRSRILKIDPSALIIFEIPLLFEAGYENFFDKTVVVYCNKKTAIDRLIAKGFSRDEILKRMRAQMPITKKKKLADFVINNNGDISNTERQVRNVFKKLQGGKKYFRRKEID
jgi:dephospho-CoA kinase